MPRKKAARLSRPIKGTWESFAKSNGLNDRRPTVRLELTVNVTSETTTATAKQKNTAKVFVSKRSFRKVE